MPLSPDVSTDAASSRPPTPVLDIVVPVHDEEAGLRRCILRLREHTETLPYPTVITIAENGSTDGTAALGAELAAMFPGVRLRTSTAPGRGRALSEAWLASEATVLVYMDVDLSTDLAALLPLVAPLISGHSDLAIGTRLAGSSRVVRGAKREFISRSYNLLLRGALATHVSDAQCGFKAIRADVAARLLPLVEDTGWFFDTELLVLAERAGLRIAEVPVDWVDDPDSRVHIVPTAKADLAGIVRIWRAFTVGGLPLADLRAQIGRRPLVEPALDGVPTGLVGQLVRFAAIGVVSTLAYLALFAVLRTGLTAQAANVVALLLTAVANTAANRRFTFGRSGRAGAVRAQGQGLTVLGLGLVLTSGSLGVLHATVAVPSTALELIVLVAANAAATVLRFLLLRHWVFRARPTAPVPAVHPELEFTR